MLRNSKLEQDEIDRERTVVQQELKRNHHSPGAWAGGLIGTPVYGAQPPGWDVGGSVELAEELQRPDFVSPLRDWYRPSHIVLPPASHPSHDRHMSMAEPLSRDMPPRETPPAGEVRARSESHCGAMRPSAYGAERPLDTRHQFPARGAEVAVLVGQ